MRWKGRWAKATKQLKGTLKKVESDEPRALVTDWWPTSASSLLPGALLDVTPRRAEALFVKQYEVLFLGFANTYHM